MTLPYFTDVLSAIFASVTSGDIRLIGFLAYVPPYLSSVGENLAVRISHAQTDGRFYFLI